MNATTAYWIITSVGIVGIVAILSVDTYGAMRERDGDQWWIGYMRGRRAFWNWIFPKK